MTGTQSKEFLEWIDERQEELYKQAKIAPLAEERAIAAKVHGILFLVLEFYSKTHREQ